jgi:fructose-specific phosphotransferase system IIA component
MTVQLDKQLILYNLKANSRKDVISKLADLFVVKGIVTDKQAYLDSVEVREREGTTGIGDGIAIPHGQTAAVTDSQVAIAKLQSPVEWNSMDGNPVEYVFLLAIPEGGSVEHLKILSEIAGDLMDDDVRARLNKARSVNDLATVF